MKKLIILLAIPLLVLCSCATASFSAYPGVGRIKQYDFASHDLPEAFDGFRIAFISDLHYESRFNHSALLQAVRALKAIHPDVLVLGGDYSSPKGGNMDTLFYQLSRVYTPYGTFAVMGNHEYAYSYHEVERAMRHHHVRLMNDSAFYLTKGADRILLAGVRNPFDPSEIADPPTRHLPDSEFTILVSHTPDYAELAHIRNANLVLAGHTHGGQVSLFKKHSFVKHSPLGDRFLTGLRETSNGTPVIITNGLGTSRIPIRLFTPSEIVLIVLHRAP